ncbi:twin-arginine translocase subunit TatC [bacterium]|nr:twin-arginine translocase subunit TatC [bacterium]
MSKADETKQDDSIGKAGNNQQETESKGIWHEMYPHFAELRYRIFMIIGWFLAACIASFVLVKPIFRLLTYPLPDDFSLYFFAPAEAFFTDIKIAVITGLIATGPAILFHLWRFISPGLRKKEKRVVLLVLPWTVILFIAGSIFTFFIVVPAGLSILLGWGKERITPVLSVGRYFSFLFGLLIAGGLLFELPIVLTGMAKLGWVTRSTLVKHLRTAIVVILILAAILTPSPDAFTMLLLSGPIILLYLLSIIIVGLVKPLDSDISS